VSKIAKGQSRLSKAQAAVEESVEMIDEQLADLEKLLRPYERIKEEIDKLRAARRALLGGSKMTGSGGSKVRQEDVVGFLKENPGSPPGIIAQALGVPQPTVSSHLYRGKDERFLSKNGNWYLRDPKSGINTVDDIEED